MLILKCLSGFKSNLVDFPTINLLIKGGSGEAKYIMSYRKGVLERRYLKGSESVYLRGSKSVHLRVSNGVLGLMLLSQMESWA